MDLLDLVAGQALAHAADDRNAAAHGRAEIDVHAVFRRRAEDLRPMLGEELLVGGDHGLAGVQRREDERPCDARAADRLHHDLHGRIGYHALRVRGQDVLVHGHAAVRRDVQVRDLPQDDVHAQALRHHRAVAQQAVRHARADGPESQYADSDFFHAFFSRFRRKSAFFPYARI